VPYGSRIRDKNYSKPVVPKVGGIAPLGEILMGEGAKSGENPQPLIQ